MAGGYRSRHATEPESVLQEYLDEGRKIMMAAKQYDPAGPALTTTYEAMRWFPLPDDSGVSV